MADAEKPDEVVRDAARRVAHAIAAAVPATRTELFEGTGGPYMVVLLHPPSEDRKFVAITLFYNGSYQIEVYGLIEIATDLPRPMDDAVHEVAEKAIRLITEGAPGYAPW